jgi:type IV pilus assembly protein PilQ
MRVLASAVLLGFGLSVGLAAPAAEAAPGLKITIDMQEAEIGNVLRLLADVSGKNLVYGEDVKGKITLKLKGVPWRQALDVICKTKGLDFEEDDNIIRIAPREVFVAEREAELKLEEQEALHGPLTTRIIPVSYARADELVEQVRGLLSPRGTVTVDKRTNTIIVRDVRGSSALRL